MNINGTELTADRLADVQSFLRGGDVIPYLPPREPVEELLQRALPKNSRSVVVIWLASNVVIGVSGLVVDPDSQDAEFWCVASAMDEHRWIVKATTELMLGQAFDVLKLHSARTSCLREDKRSVNALRNAKLAEEGIQRNCFCIDGKWKDRILFGMVRDDWNTNETLRDKGFVAQFRREDRGPFYAALLLQVVILAALCYLGYVAAGWIGLLCIAVTGAVVVQIDRLVFERIRQERRIGSSLLTIGFLLSLAFSGFVVLQVLYRIRWVDGVSTSWLVVALLIGLIGVLQLAAISKVIEGHVPWMWVGAFIISAPMLFIWIPLSETAEEWTMSSSMIQGSMNWRDKKQERAQIIEERRTWNSSGRDQARVAVALSGGGYRAALIHAGVLAALDRHHVPIRYLSTVSGGSIIGAYYSLGYPPADFIRGTWEQKPGLAFNKLSVFGSLGSWLSPWASDADVYADYFARSYFGRATLHDLPDTPVLIVNATDIEADPANAREVFFREIAERAPHLAESIRVADVVAASGSFPVAFEPKTTRWFAIGKEPGPESVVPRRFVDGGVLENIGLEGLKRYLHLRKVMKLDVNKPDVLIVSDASLPSVPSPLSAKAELLDLLTRVQNISYSAFQRRLLSQFTGHDDYLRWMSGTGFALQYAEVPYSQIDPDLEAGAPEVLRVIVIPATAPQLQQKLREPAFSRCSYHGRGIGEVQGEVARFDTLKELTPEEVEKAAWLGSALITLYWDAIQCSLDKSRNPTAVCVTSAAPGACPEFADIAHGIQQ